MEQFDVLVPPDFHQSGQIVNAQQARENGAWLGTFNLWILQTKPVPAIIYQQRHHLAKWMPDKLDVSVGGHLQAGEKPIDGLREAEEEIGKVYSPEQLTFVGRKLTVSLDSLNRQMNYVVHLYLTIDNSPLSSFRQQEDELQGLFLCPIDELIGVHTDSVYHFEAEGILPNGRPAAIDVNSGSFPYNYDNYHFKMALLAKRFLAGEQSLLY